MEFRDIRRSVIALIAAYAVALQALLAPFALATLATPDTAFAILCSHDGSGSSGQPAQHDLPCAAMCAAIGHGVVGPLPPVIAVALAPPRTIGALNPVNNWIAPRLTVRGPQAARAPPLA
jgi:hypothetical protein